MILSKMYGKFLIPQVRQDGTKGVFLLTFVSKDPLGRGFQSTSSSSSSYMLLGFSWGENNSIYNVKQEAPNRGPWTVCRSLLEKVSQNCD